jgi:hypothetical protein
MGTQVYAHDKVKLTLLQVMGLPWTDFFCTQPHRSCEKPKARGAQLFYIGKGLLPFSIMPHNKLGQIHCAIKNLESFSPASLAGWYNDMN